MRACKDSQHHANGGSEILVDPWPFYRTHGSVVCDTHHPEVPVSRRSGICDLPAESCCDCAPLSSASNRPAARKAILIWELTGLILRPNIYRDYGGQGFTLS